MRTLFIISLSCLLIFFFTIPLTAQWIEDNGLRGRLTSYRSVSNPIVLQETSREVVGIPTQHRMQPDFKYWTNSLQARRMQLSFLNKRFVSKGVQKCYSPMKKTFFAQSQISVIDTAIVKRFGNYKMNDLGDTTRHSYSFSKNAKMTSDLMQILIGDAWVDTLLQTITYDASGNELSFLYEYWSDGQLVNWYRNTYTYDANDNELSELQEGWSNGQWVNGYRMTFTYNASDNMLSLLYESWSNGQWVNDWHCIYTYDTNGNMLSGLYQEWSNGQWVNNSSCLQTNDANGNMLSYLYEVWSNNQWLIEYRDTYTYDANGNELSELEEDWSNSQWVNAYRHTYIYDGNGNRLSYLYEIWSNGQWMNESRDTYTYDANGNELSFFQESWRAGQWVNIWRETYTYDTNGNLTSYWCYNWSNSTWAPSNNRIFWVTDNAGNEYGYSGYNFTLTYKTVSTGVASEGSKLPVSYSLSQNYPNPSNPSTTIMYELPKSSEVRLTVYDVLGRRVSVLVNERMNAGVHEVKFDGSNLASGVYFYRLQAGTYVNVKKLVLLK